MFASVCADEITEAEDEFVVSGLDKQEEGSGGEGCVDGGGEAVGDSCTGGIGTVGAGAANIGGGAGVLLAGACDEVEDSVGDSD